MLRDRLGISERWACRVVGQHRSTERYEPKRAEDDAALRVELRKFSAERPRWGYRRAHHHLREQQGICELPTTPTLARMHADYRRSSWTQALLAIKCLNDGIALSGS